MTDLMEVTLYKKYQDIDKLHRGALICVRAKNGLRSKKVYIWRHDKQKQDAFFLELGTADPANNDIFKWYDLEWVMDDPRAVAMYLGGRSVDYVAAHAKVDFVGARKEYYELKAKIANLEKQEAKIQAELDKARAGMVAIECEEKSQNCLDI